MKIHILILAIITSIGMTIGSVEAISQKEQRIQLDQQIESISKPFIDLLTKKLGTNVFQRQLSLIINQDPKAITVPDKTLLKKSYGKYSDNAIKSIEQTNTLLNKALLAPAETWIELNKKTQIIDTISYELSQNIKKLSEKIVSIKKIGYRENRYATEIAFIYAVNAFNALEKLLDTIDPEARFYKSFAADVNKAAKIVDDIAQQERKSLKIPTGKGMQAAFGETLKNIAEPRYATEETEPGYVTL